VWIIQNEVLIQLPDDVPVPSGSRVIEVADEFVRSPRAFRVAGGQLVRAEARPRSSADRLTRDEIVQLKKALASGAIGTGVAKPSAEDHPPVPQQPKKKGAK
jgi:hypothetical protein